MMYGFDDDTSLDKVIETTEHIGEDGKKVLITKEHKVKQSAEDEYPVSLKFQASLLYNRALFTSTEDNRNFGADMCVSVRNKTIGLNVGGAAYLSFHGSMSMVMLYIGGVYSLSFTPDYLKVLVGADINASFAFIDEGRDVAVSGLSAFLVAETTLYIQRFFGLTFGLKHLIVGYRVYKPPVILPSEYREHRYYSGKKFKGYDTDDEDRHHKKSKRKHKEEQQTQQQSSLLYGICGMVNFGVRINLTTYGAGMGMLAAAGIAYARS